MVANPQALRILLPMRKILPRSLHRLISSHPKAVLAILVLVACIGGAGPIIVKHSIEYDEAISLLVLSGNSAPQWPEEIQRAGQLAEVFSGAVGPAGIVRELRTYDVHPPLYFWMLGSWRTLFGDGIEAARAFSLLCTAATAVLLGWMLLSAGGRLWWSAGAGLLFVLSPIGIYTATTARPYALALLLIVGAAFAAFRLALLIHSSSNRPVPKSENFLAMLSGALAGLAVLSNYLALVPAGLVGIWLAVQLLMQRRWFALLLAAAMAAIPLGMVLYMLSGQFGSRPDWLVGFEGWDTVYQILHAALDRLAPYKWAYPTMKEVGDPLALSVTGLLLLSGFVMALRDYVSARPRRRLFWSLTLLLAIGHVVGLVLVSVFIDKHLTYPRFTYAAIPFLACVAAFSAMRDGPVFVYRAGRLLLILMLTLQAAWIWEMQDLKKHIQEWRTLAQFATPLVRDDAVVLVDAGYGRGVPASMVYELSPDTKVRIFDKDSKIRQVLRDIAPYHYVFMVMSWSDEGQKNMSTVADAMQKSGYYAIRRQIGRHFLVERLRK